ncbi:MAG: hypothetical protein RR271_07645 [Oscillospiraceae bacterium]
MNEYLPGINGVEERIVEKEIVLRLYGTALSDIKSALREAAKIPGIKPFLYGKDNEFLIRLTATSGGAAASDQLCESAAFILSEKFGDDIYGRGKSTLAHVAAGVLIENSARLATINSDLGEALEAEFATTKRGEHAFCKGDKTYKNGASISPSDKTVRDYGANSIQAATELAFISMKKGKAKYGSAITAPDENGRRWAVVTQKKHAFVRQLPPDASKRACALAVLDLVRRLVENDSLQSGDSCYKKGRVKTGKSISPVKSSKKVFVSIFLLIIAVVLGCACYYYFNIYAPLPDNSAMQVLIGK